MIKNMDQFTREDIIESAIDLFSQYGYHNVTMSQLAEYMGYSKPHIYRHFKSKKSIMYACIRMIRNLMQTDIPRLEEIRDRLKNETPKQMLLSYCYGSDEFSYRSFVYYRLLYREIFNFNRVAAIAYRIWQNNHSVLCAILDHLAGLNEIPKQADGTLTELWSRVVFGFTLCKTFDPYIYGKQYKEITELFIQLALNGNNRLECGEIMTWDTKPESFQNAESFKEEIIHAACDLFSDYGYEKTTIKLLANKLNCHGSSIYNHFEDKLDLMSHIFETMKKNNHDYLHSSLMEKYSKTKKIEDLIAVFSNSYITQSDHERKCNRIWINMVYKSRDIRHYCFGCLDDKRVAFKIAIHELTEREITNNESMHLATIYTFCQTSLNIENALFHKEMSDSAAFRLNVSRILVSLLLYGVIPRKYPNDIKEATGLQITEMV